ncbi:MAG: Pyrophosphatase PpaX [Promethearchaeota archaeon]|nr:MAG: Pyrophosphatase PpaX [Candidatus Lokiarchaeota archaeon]
MNNKISFLDIKALVFDLDGTIVDLKVNWNKLKNLLKRRYSNLYKESCRFNSISQCLSIIVEKGDEKILNNFFDIIRDYELRSIDQNSYIEETVYFLKNLNQFDLDNNIKLGILSLNTRAAILNSLEMINLKDKFDIIIGREDVRHWKPDPEGLLKIKQALKIKKEEMVYFGDMKKDLLTGKNAGIDAYFITDLIEYVKFYNNKMKLD